MISASIELTIPFIRFLIILLKKKVVEVELGKLFLEQLEAIKWILFFLSKSISLEKQGGQPMYIGNINDRAPYKGEKEQKST
jgi:hypothetical protein